jgi:plasmid rolling circle replication initiator protein Rep
MLAGDGIEPLPEDTFYLTEVSPQDKPWDKHRSEADSVRILYQDSVYDCYAQRISGCSGLLQFDFVASPETGETRLKLSACRFCRVRHCPVCQWRRQLRWRARFFNALPRILEDYPKARFLFLTLTVRNCPISELRDTLTWMNKSWVLLTKRKQFPGLGWLKSVEVTKGSSGDAHPHFHVILMVNESYFKRGYLSKQKWIQLWRESLRVDYDPSVNIQAIKSTAATPDQLGEDLMKGFCEVLKYSLKPEDLVSDKEWLIAITQQLHKTRAVAVGGVFRKYISEKEPEDLIGEDENPEDDAGLPVWFGWREAIARYVKVRD